MCRNRLTLNELKFTVNITPKALHKRDPQNNILEAKNMLFFLFNCLLNLND